MAERKLIDLDGTRSRTPFEYHQWSLGELREDQKPRFFAALTDPDTNTTVEELTLASLFSMQDRVDTAKVEAMAALDNFDGPLPVVVRLNAEGNGAATVPRDHIADGHHRLAAVWLRGDETASVRVKDLREPSNAMKAGGKKAITGKLVKADESLGLALGWAIISTENGQPYYDTQDDHIPADVMTKAAADFMASARTVDLQHSGIMGGKAPNNHGQVTFAMPWTADIAKAFGIEAGPVEGLMIAVKLDDPAALAKFRDGSFTGFSIGGQSQEVEDAA